MEGKLQLPTTTLLAVDCVDLQRIIPVIERCKSLCDFGDVRLLTSIPTDYPHVKINKLDGLTHYSIFCLKELYKYVDNAHFLIVQHDGWILNPDAWTDEWLQYDYMGAVFNQEEIMGAGGFSFRSTKLMEAVSKLFPDFDGTTEHAEELQGGIGCYEDGAIAMGQRPALEEQGFKYPSIEVASKFCQGGNPDNKFFEPKPFGFHRPDRVIDIEQRLIYPAYLKGVAIPKL